MKTGWKIFWGVIAGVAVGLIVWALTKPKKERTIEVVSDPTARGGAGMGTGLNSHVPAGKWIVKGDKPQGQHCPMGQSEIWDGTKWVCAVRSADQK